MEQPSVNQPRGTTPPKMLNLGCGRTYHRNWLNLDLQASDPTVCEHDILTGLPFEANSIDVVYHSHVLEHLTPEQGEQMLTECWRVLKPGGILRIVVPDLEQIARLYLENHEQAWSGDKVASARYEWMKLELLDQMVRCRSGGRMGRFMAELPESEAGFVRSRAGCEFQICRSPDEGSPVRISNPQGFDSKLQPAEKLSWRERVVSFIVRKLLGIASENALLESLFRSRGEVHRWMYDRFSLRKLCSAIGFVDLNVRSAYESAIPEFASYQLDTEKGQVRKPDSLFIECRKPLRGSAKMAG